MNRSKRVRACLSVLTTLTLTAGAPFGSLADATAPRITAETVVRYLQQDLFLKPGVGFKRVKIGKTFDEVQRVWGQPNRGSDGGTKSRLDDDIDEGTRWVYVTGRDSEIRVSGNSRVRDIEVLGSLNTPFASTEGASFGMTPQQVISIYGPPTNPGNLREVIYAAEGIAFGFEQGGLRAMRVFRPDDAGPSADPSRPTLK